MSTRFWIMLVSVVAMSVQPVAPARQCIWEAFMPPNPGPSDNTLDAVAVVNSSDVWAGGWYTDASGNGHAQFQHFNGTAWTAVAAPAGNDPLVNAMAGLDGDSVWAVGSVIGINNGIVPIIYYWNGKTWAVFSNPAQNTNGELSSIVAIGKRELWAAGFEEVAGKIKPLIEHFNGQRWKIDKAYVPPSQAILNAVTGTSADNLWAGGYYNGGGAALIERYVPLAHKWVQSQTTVGNDIGSMSARSDSDVWAVGAPDGSADFAERWNGRSWGNVKLPRQGITYLHAVSATDPQSYAWLEGFYYESSSQVEAVEYRYRKGHWDDTSVVQPGQYTFLFALSPVENSSALWAVGTYASNSLQSLDLTERWTCLSASDDSGGRVRQTDRLETHQQAVDRRSEVSTRSAWSRLSSRKSPSHRR